MKQLLHDFRSGQVIVAEAPRPAVERGAVLVRNLFSAVSPGTERAAMRSHSRNLLRTAMERKDLVQRVLAKARRDGIMAAFHTVSRKLDASLPLGYSSAGVVVEVGPDVADIKPGDLVACAGAGYAVHAEYVCVPRMLCAAIPRGLGPDAAAFATLGAIAMQGVRQASLTLGENVAVIGLGILGQLTVQLVQAAGGHPIAMDLHGGRVAKAAQCAGAEGVVIGDDAERRVRELTEGKGADCVIVTAATRGSEPMHLAAAIARDRGRIVMVGDVGMELRRAPFYEKELELRLSRSYGPGRYDPSYELAAIDYPIAYVRWTENRNLREFLRLAQEGKARPLELVDWRYTVEEAAQALNDISGGGDMLGALIQYPAEAEAAGARQRVTLRPSLPQKDKVRIGVLGAGDFTRGVLLPELAKIKRAQLIAVCSARGLNARDLARKYGCEFCSTDFNEMLESADLDGVVIATPHHLHAEQAARALRAGKSVYLEKPAAINEEQLNLLREAAREAAGCFFVGYNRRFSPMGVGMRDFFADRRGPIVIHYRVNAGALPSGHWQLDPNIGGGRIVGEACHFLDFAKFVVGRPVKDVNAHGTGESPDDLVANLLFEDGSVATISYITSGPAGWSKERIEVIGCGKSCIIEDFRRFLTSGGRPQKSALPDGKGHREALQAFVECTAGQGMPAFEAEDLFETAIISFRLRSATI